MQDPIFPPTLTQKLYSENHILLATFIGGPLAGGYLLAQNFKALDQPSKVTKTWLGTVAAFLLIIFSSFVPALDNLPAIVYSFVFCLTAHTAAKKFQGGSIALHRQNGGQLYNGWYAALAGFISLLVMLVIFLAIFFLQGNEMAD